MKKTRLGKLIKDRIDIIVHLKQMPYYQNECKNYRFYATDYF